VTRSLLEQLKSEAEMADWLRNLVIVGFEETEAEKQAREAAERHAAEEGDEDEEDEEEEEEEGEEKPDVEKLKAALRKERKRARDAEKAKRKAEREAAKHTSKSQKQEEQEKSDLQKAKDAEIAATQRADKLQQKLRDQALDAEVTKQAIKMGFRDVDDAISLMKKDPDMVDGEDDDISVDEDAVTEALEDLAKKKPHLIVDDEEEEQKTRRSGSKFGGKRKTDTGKMSEEEMRRKYPGLGPSDKPIRTGGGE
jgi:hypothetical protein